MIGLLFRYEANPNQMTKHHQVKMHHNLTLWQNLLHQGASWPINLQIFEIFLQHGADAFTLSDSKKETSESIENVIKKTCSDRPKDVERLLALLKECKRNARVEPINEETIEQSTEQSGDEENLLQIPKKIKDAKHARSTLIRLKFWKKIGMIKQVTSYPFALPSQIRFGDMT